MVWVRIDDHLPEHPKVLKAGPLAGWLYVCGLAYCARNLTDGFIPTAQVKRLSDVKQPMALADRLVTAGLWESTTGGFKVHDYLVYQPSKTDVEIKRKAVANRVEKLRNTRRDHIESNGVTTTEKPQDCNAIGNASPVPSPIPDPYREESTTPPPTKRHRETEITTEFIEAMVVKYAPLFGDEETVRGSIAEATNHKAMLKRIDKRQYLRTWLDNDLKYRAQRRMSTNGHTPAPVRKQPTYTERDWLPLPDKMALEEQERLEGKR